MSYTYIKSLSIDFPNGLINSQLMYQITISIPTPLQSVTVMNDVVSIIFDSIIPDESVLNNIIANFIPIEYDFATPYLVDNVLTTKINNQEYKYFGNEYSEIIISPDSQSHYNSLSAALAANNTANQIFVIYPGVYVENNPIILPSGTTVKSLGSASNTIIVASDHTQDLIRLNEKCKISCLTLAGAYQARGIYFNGSLSGGSGQISIISECMVVDCDVGVECDGNNSPMADTLFAEKLIISATIHTLSKGIYCHGAGQFVTSISYVVGVPGSFPVLNAYDCQGAGSKISLSTSSVWFCNKGLYIDNNGNAEISLLNAQYNNIGVEIGTTGTASRLSTSSLVIKNSVTYDINIQASNANVEIYSSFLDDSKLNNPNNVGIIVRYNALVYGQAYNCSIGDSAVGNPFIPSKLGIGEGLYINSGVVIMSNNNMTSGTWVDHTYDALICDASIPLPGFDIFQDVSSNNCLYFGSEKDIFGFKINVITSTTSITELDDIIWEFWNGSSWVEFYVMQTYPDYPCNTYDKSFVSIVSKFHIRFGLTSNAPFALLSLNGFNKNWLRLRVVNTLSSIPRGGYLKIHTNSTRINNDGYTELFGSARTNNALSIHPYPSTASPGNQTFYINENLSMMKYNNIFPSNALNRIGFNFKMPTSIDISFPIKLNLSFIGDNTSAGDVEWVFRYTYTKEDSPIYLTLLDSQNNPNPNVMTITKITNLLANQNNKDKRDTINIDIHTIPGNPSGVNHIFYGTLERNSGVNLDTYPGNIMLAHIDANYISWAHNGHMLGF